MDKSMKEETVTQPGGCEAPRQVGPGRVRITRTDHQDSLDRSGGLLRPRGPLRWHRHRERYRCRQADRLVSGSAWIARLITASLMCTSGFGCLQVNEVGPDPLFDGLNSLLIEQDDGGYRAISLCSSDPFLTDGDVKALGFKASLSELGLGHGSTVVLNKHLLSFAPQPLVWSEANQEWSEGPDLAEQPPSHLRASMVDCGAVRGNAPVEFGWFADLRRLTGTHEGAVMTRDGYPDERYWMSSFADASPDTPPTIMKSEELDPGVIDVAASDAGNIWLVGNELRADRDGRTLTTTLLGDPVIQPPVQTPVIAQDRSGSRVAVLSARGAGAWFLSQYELDPRSGFTLLRDSSIELPQDGVYPVESEALVFSSNNEIVGLIRGKGLFSASWSDGVAGFPRDGYAANVRVLVQLLPERYASFAFGASEITIRDSGRDFDLSCSISSMGEITGAYSVAGRLLLLSTEGVIDASDETCDIVLAADSSDVGEVLGFAVLPNRSCESGEPSLVLSPAQFGSTSDSCYNQQVTGRIDDQ